MFRLPDFLRTAWVSDRARETWAPRFEAIREAWPCVFLNAAAAHKMECMIRVLPPWMIFRLQADAQREGLEAVVLGTRGLATPEYASLEFTPANAKGRPFLYSVAIGSQAACAAIQEHWRNQQYAAAYRLAGAPDCCVNEMESDIALQRSDAVWRYTGVEQSVEADAGSIVDPLWFFLNIGALSLAPCTLGCAAAHGKRQDLVKLARESGYSQEMDWMEQAFAWPVEWTALHGIAELKTPVMKAVWTTDVAHRKATLRYHGPEYPGEGATGLSFPFRSQARPLLTSSQAFQRGMANLIQIRC